MLFDLVRLFHVAGEKNIQVTSGEVTHKRGDMLNEELGLEARQMQVIKAVCVAPRTRCETDLSDLKA